MNTYDGTFVLTIKLGNEKMRTMDDVQHALAKVSILVGEGTEYGSILDINGNNVGGFALPPANTEEK